jgi:hypothetical protein
MLRRMHILHTTMLKREDTDEAFSAPSVLAQCRVLSA